MKKIILVLTLLAGAAWSEDEIDQLMVKSKTQEEFICNVERHVANMGLEPTMYADIGEFLKEHSKEEAKKKLMPCAKLVNVLLFCATKEFLPKSELESELKLELTTEDKERIQKFQKEVFETCDIRIMYMFGLAFNELSVKLGIGDTHFFDIRLLPFEAYKIENDETSEAKYREYKFVEKGKTVMIVKRSKDGKYEIVDNSK